jgi:hypothetical protein
MLSRIGEIQTPLPASQAMLIGLMAAILVYARILWNIVNHAETVVHEGAHALAGIVTGRRIRSVKINTDGGGATTMTPDTGFGFGVAASAGYIGSSGAGLIAAGLISLGRIVAVLGLGLLLLVAMLLIVRNFFGLIVILICGALLYLIVRYTTTGVQTVIAYGVTWFLLISGPKVAARAARKPKDVTDAGILAGMTFLWPSAWCFLWLAGTIGALVVGGAILIGALDQAGYESTPGIHVWQQHSTSGELSTIEAIARYAQALGGHLELVANFDDHAHGDHYRSRLTAGSVEKREGPVSIARVWESIASATWSRDCLASMGIAPEARKRSCNSGSLRRRYSRVSPMRPQSLSWRASIRASIVGSSISSRNT